MFNLDASFQLGECLLVLLLAFALQLHLAPYMPPSAFESVLAAHAKAALGGSRLHARLHATLLGVEARGRKPTHLNVMAAVRACRAGPSADSAWADAYVPSMTSESWSASNSGRAARPPLASAAVS